MFLVEEFVNLRKEFIISMPLRSITMGEGRIQDSLILIGDDLALYA
jgi:hypothetical protein